MNKLYAASDSIYDLRALLSKLKVITFGKSYIPASEKFVRDHILYNPNLNLNLFIKR